MAVQGGAKHRNVRAHHEQLNHIFGAMNAACSSQTGLDAPIQDADPCQRQAQGLGCAQQDIRPNFEFIEVDVRLVKAIEQNQAINASEIQLLGHIGHATEKGAQLNGNRKRNRNFYATENIKIGLLQVAGGTAGVEKILEKINRCKAILETVH
jgi:hypothetical protein